MLWNAMLAMIIAGALFKTVLLLLWTKRLHATHAEKYSFWEIFRMMFGPQSELKVGKEFWTDFQPVQRWNLLSNVLIVLSAIVAFGVSVFLVRTLS